MCKFNLAVFPVALLLGGCQTPPSVEIRPTPNAIQAAIAAAGQRIERRLMEVMPVYEQPQLKPVAEETVRSIRVDSEFMRSGNKTARDSVVMLAPRFSSEVTGSRAIQPVEIQSPKMPSLPANLPPDLLSEKISASWIGDAEPFVKKIADQLGLKFYVVGPPPAVPLIITISAQQTPASLVLHNVGIQISMRGAQIALTPAGIELRYDG